MAKQKMSIKKKASAIVAGVLAVTLALGGAYAWTDYNQTARNTFRGLAAGDVVLHDDYSGENKDVYVENTGDTAVYVRVKFAEYLQVGNSSLLTSSVSEDPDQKGDPNDVTTWSTHQFVADVTVPADFTEDNACTGNAASAHDYFDWFMSGESKAYLSGTTVSDGNGYGGLSEETFEKYATNAKQPGELPEGKITIGDITTDVYNTLGKSEIVTMKEYMDLYTKNKDGQSTDQTESDRWKELSGTARWIVDTDGWAYWSKALQPYSATNLLLDAVTADTESDAILADNWVYNIDVQLQAATLNDLNAWVRDGQDVEVADPDNQVATTTELGFDFLTALAGGSLTTAEGYVVGADGEYYAPEGPNAYYKLDENNEPTGDLILAGQDKLPGNEDDDMLSGRSAEWGGAIAIGTIFLPTDDAATLDDGETITEPYYTIEGLSDDYYVTSGIDKLLGTYDDVIRSKTGALGQYEIDKDIDGLEYVGWNYLGGAKDNMLVATEYVLDNLKYNASTSDGNVYLTSNLKTQIEEIGERMGITATVKTVDLDMSDTQHTGNYVITCTNPDHPQGTEKHNTLTGNCITDKHGIYYTNDSSKGQANIAGTKFFALSLNEVISAYGDGTSNAICQTRIVQAAPAYVCPTPSAADANHNYNNCTTWTDGNGDFITTTFYYLRSPGYDATRHANVNTYGQLHSLHVVNVTGQGARPACYLDLSASSAS